jgi:hypothetical protein
MDLLAFAKNIADRVEAQSARAKYRLPFVLSMFTATSFSSTA